MASTNQEPSAGRRFELLRTLGVGSFGSVYLAEMEGAGGFRRRVALKLLNPTWDQVSDASSRLRDEARILGRLQHRHIVRVDDLIRLEGRWALVMEYIEGVDLEAVVAPPGGATFPVMPPRAALEIIAAAASALRAASETVGGDGRPLAVVHRDIKPSNIRVTPNGDVKVLDFGVARADFAGREAKTERVRYGSLGYMSPERLLGGEETSAGDVYALGVVLTELVLRQAYGRSELAEAAQVAQVDRSVAALAPVAGEEVAGLVREMLAYEPTARPTAHAVEERIRKLLPTFSEGDLLSWCVVAVPKLDQAAAADDGAVRGRVLAESDLSGRAIVNSATLALPADAEFPPLAAPQPSKPGTTGSETISLAVESPEPPARVGGPLRMAWLVAAITALGAVGGTAYVMMQPSEPTVDHSTAPTRAAPPPAPAAVAPAAAELQPQAPLTVEAPQVTAAPGGSGAPVPHEPATPAPRPAGAVRPSEPVPAVLAAPDPGEPVQRLRSAKFVLEGSTEPLQVTCGDVRGSGSGNALVQSFPAGPCTVRAGGASTTVNVQEPRKVDCTLEGGSLSCR